MIRLILLYLTVGLLLTIFLAAPLLGAPGDPWERAIIARVASEYSLTPHQTKLLQAIRMAEAGGAGLEFGVAQYQPRHPARQYVAFPERSLQVQAKWAAGTIKKRYRGDLDAFAKRYVASPKAGAWVHNVKHHMR